jgi:hypothetical protein
MIACASFYGPSFIVMPMVTHRLSARVNAQHATVDMSINHLSLLSCRLGDDIDVNTDYVHQVGVVYMHAYAC